MSKRKELGLTEQQYGPVDGSPSRSGHGKALEMLGCSFSLQAKFDLLNARPAYFEGSSGYPEGWYVYLLRSTHNLWLHVATSSSPKHHNTPEEALQALVTYLGKEQ